MADPTADYQKMLADAEADGAKAYRAGRNEATNPWLKPPTKLAGPAAAWDRGWQSEREKMDKWVVSQDAVGKWSIFPPGTSEWQKETAEKMSRVPPAFALTAPPTLRERAALAALPAMVAHHVSTRHFGNSPNEALAAAVAQAVSVADMLAKALDAGPAVG